jgi:hypothetical protein
MVGRRACGPARSQARAAHRSRSQASVLSARRRAPRNHPRCVQQVRLAGCVLARRTDCRPWCGLRDAQPTQPSRRTELQPARLSLGSLRGALRRANRGRPTPRVGRDGGVRQELAAGIGRSVINANQAAPPYSITSSAMASNVGGTVMPSALAVLRLITSSNLVGSRTGRSAGFSPRRMRST